MTNKTDFDPLHPDFDRRKFLSRAALGTSAIWLTACFAKDEGEPVTASAPPVTTPRADMVFDRLHVARNLGKPLMVLVIPADEVDVWERGHAWGDLLHKGSTETLANLAMCEVVCAKVEDVKVHVDGLDQAGDPTLVLIETQGDEWEVRPVEFEMPRMSRWAPPAIEGSDGEVRMTPERRLAEISGVMHSLLALDPIDLEARAHEVRKRLSRSDLELLEEPLDHLADLPLDLVDRGAAVLRHQAEVDATHRDALLETLARVTTKRLVEGPPVGAHWANNQGCGNLEIEGVEPEEPQYGFLCGIGMTPALSWRFLYFFVDPAAH